MISGELDILKDWCYEAVSTAFIILVKWQSKKKKSEGLGMPQARHFPACMLSWVPSPALQR